MKKSSLLVTLACVVFLIWTMSCQSPSSADNPSSSAQVENNQSNATNDSGSSDSGAKTNMGFLRLILKDAPIDNIKSVFVKIKNIRVHRTNNDGEDSFVLIVEGPLEKVDLRALEDTPLVFDDTLPAGTYNQIRMEFVSGYLVFENGDGSETSDEEGPPLIVPSGEIKTNLHFEVPEQGLTQITLDLDVKNSIHIVKKGKKDVYHLRPVIHVVDVSNGQGT